MSPSFQPAAVDAPEHGPDVIPKSPKSKKHLSGGAKRKNSRIKAAAAAASAGPVSSVDGVDPPVDEQAFVSPAR